MKTYVELIRDAELLLVFTHDIRMLIALFGNSPFPISALMGKRDTVGNPGLGRIGNAMCFAHMLLLARVYSAASIFLQTEEKGRFLGFSGGIWQVWRGVCADQCL